MSRKIVITGASSEIGLAIASKIVKPKDSLVLQFYSNSSDLEKWAEQSGSKFKLVGADFSTVEGVAEFLPHLQDADVLINCAALVSTGLLVTMEDQTIEKMFQVNCMAPLKICQAVIPSMVGRRQGTIVNISSVTATRGNRGQSVYAGTKGFVEAFSRSLAAEYGPKGVRINCVSPGPTEAGSTRELLEYAEDTVKNSTALKKLGTPDDVAALVTFLCSDEAAFITGKTYAVDGGFMQGV